MTIESMAPPRHGRRPKGWHALKWLIITVTAALAPLFFIVMFTTVVHLLRPSLGPWAWIVPVATEGCFVIAYLLGILLEWAGKPMRWLRFVPWFFAASSLVLNVWGSLGDVPGMLGHAVVTVSFFLPLIAGESAVHSLARSDEELSQAAEMADARRYALDLVRDREGHLWRFRVPSLLRSQILHGRPPAAVGKAVRDGAGFGGAEKWEGAVEAWIADGLTRGEKMAVTVKRQKAAIAASDDSATVTAARPSVPRQKGRKALSPFDRAVKVLTENPGLTVKEAAAMARCSESTMERARRKVPRPLRSVAGAR